MRTGPDSVVSVPGVARPDGSSYWLAGARLSGWLRSHPKAPRTSWKDFGVFAAAGGLATAGLAAMADLLPLAAALAIGSVGLGLGWGITWLIVRQTLSRPIDRIATSMETLAARDVLALVDEFANLADGEPPGQIEVYAKAVALPSDPSARRLAEALNTTIARLQGGAHQFHAASQDVCRRLFYVGPDDYLLGVGCAEAMGALLPNGGAVLLMTPRFRHSGVELRRRGFENTLRERYPAIHVAGAVESRFDRTRTAVLVKSFIKSHPQLAGIYCTEAMGVVGCIDALTELNLTGRVAVICHDAVEGTMASVRAGIVAATITQDPFGQGHDVAIHLFNAVACGWRPQEPRLITTSDTVTRDNYREHWQPYVGLIDSAATAERRARPLGVAGRHVRIAVCGVDDTPFWEPVRNGVIAAAEELARCNASVDWIVPEFSHEFDVGVRGPAIDGLVDEGYDAIATPLYDLNLVPYLNRAVAKGVVVATFNSEASSLQGLVATLSKERRALEIATGDLQVAVRRDPLTGAYNRRVMDADLEQAQLCMATTNRPATIVMLDIDHFKAYNDLYGHAAGDDVLRLVAQRIQRDIRPTDRLYRYGGEEFLVLLADTHISEGEAVAARIALGIATLGLTHKKNAPWGVITVSAGVAAYVADHPSTADCVAAADAALYRSKTSGRNTVATSQQEARPEPSAGAGRSVA
jgi:diguanylate cyclase (GGDEF)-like protein